MRLVVQRVSRGAVRRADGGEVLGRIERGLTALVGFGDGDGDDEVDWMADKLCGLRIFDDREGKMNLDLADVDGGLLLVPQFTLYGDVSRGRRPSFVDAADPGPARELFDRFVHRCRERHGRVETGEFGAMMDVEIVNDGPVTILLER